MDSCLNNNFSLKLAGDTFDSCNPTSQDVFVFRTQIDRMMKQGLPVFAIQGNHDKGEIPWCAAIHPHVQYVHNKIFYPIDDYPMFGIDYMPANELEAFVANIPTDVTTCLMHQAAKPVLSIPGSWNFDPEWLPEHVSTVIMGDIHMPTAFTFGNGGTGYYTGSAHMLSIAEPWEKSVLFEQVVDGKLEITRVTLPCRRYFKTSINTLEQQQGVYHLISTAGIEDEITPVIIIEHSGIQEIPSVVNSAKLERKDGNGKLRDCYVWLIPTGGTRIKIDDKSEVQENVGISTTLASCTTDGAIHTFVLDLIQKPSTSAVLEELKTKLQVI